MNLYSSRPAFVQVHCYKTLVVAVWDKVSLNKFYIKGIRLIYP